MRNFLAVVGGIVLGGLLVGLILSISHRFYGATEEMSSYDPESIKNFLESLPIAAYVWVIIGHSVGAFVAAAIASRFTDDNHLYLGIVAAGILLLFSIINYFTMIGHPTWFMIVEPIVIVILGYLGAIIGSKKAISLKT